MEPPRQLEPDTVEYWRQQAKYYEQKVNDIQQELDEYTENSAQLEKELETSLVQVENQNRDLKLQNQRFKNEIDLLRKKLERSQHETNALESELQALKIEKEKQAIYIREIEQKNDDLERGQRSRIIFGGKIPHAINIYRAKNCITFLYKTFVKLCRYVRTMNKINATEETFKIDSKIYEFMGTSNNTEFTTDGQSIIYHNGPSSTVVLLVCAQVDGQLYVYSTSTPNKVVLSFYSRYACLRQIEEPGRSLGSTLLIIFFSCVVFYLVLGICVRKFLMGATGIEVIPNLGFWTDLPNLVRDGWAFAINGFKLPVRGAGPVTSPDPNSYDSI